MNFLLHLRLARRDLPAPAAAIGAMLPDVWRLVDRSVRPALAAPAHAGGATGEVLAGVDHHARADAAFHACAAFLAGEASMASALREIDAPKLSLFAHVAWELCLDGALMRREGDAVLSALREGVDAATRRFEGETPLDAAARLHHEARGRGALPEGFSARVAQLLGDIARGPWIAGYASGARVAERLDGIRRRLKLPPLTAPARDVLGALLDDAIARANDPLDAVLALRV